MKFGRAVISSAGESRLKSRGDLEISAEYQDQTFLRQPMPPPAIQKSGFPQPLLPSATCPTTTTGPTLLNASKSLPGDVALCWSPSTAGLLFAGTRASNAAFFSALTMFSGLSGGTYTYAGGLTNGRTSEFFDVTNPSETNSGTVNNGGSLPPIPPTITAPPAGTFYIGLTGATLTGSNFSTVAPDNAVWFPGGVQAFASAVNGTATQLTFDIPPGAVSGNINSSIQNDLVSNGVKGDVFLENPVGNGLTTIRSLGFAPSTGDYWFAGIASGTPGLYRYFYDTTTTKKWLKEDRSGTNHEFMNCSTKTDRFNRIYCAMTTTSTSGTSFSRMSVTNPPGNLQICRIISAGILSGVGDSVSLFGAAADPNPDAVAGRDMVYFAFRNSSRIPTEHYIVQVPVDATGCGVPTTAQQNYGNIGGAGLVLKTIVGMAVDRDGSLYFSDGTTVRKITTSQTVTTVKSGFSQLFGLDVKQEVNGGTVSFIGADAPSVAGNASTLKSWSSDNAAVPPMVVRNTVSERFATWGATVASPTWSVAQQKRNVAVCNDTTKFPLDGDYRLIVTPDAVDLGRTWISSPGNDLNDKGNPDQTCVRSSNTSLPNICEGLTGGFSTMEVKAYWSDGVSRLLCARTGDPKSSAPYEPAVATPSNCNRPWVETTVFCDNSDPFSNGGPGSFTENGALDYCQPAPCGSSPANACKFHVRVTQRYAGDNVQLYFYEATPTSATIPPEIIQTTAPITAWKHIHEEVDTMCRIGGIISLDATAGQNCIYLGKVFNSLSSSWLRVDNIAEDTQIKIFDADHPYEATQDIAYAHLNNLDFVQSGQHYVEVCLRTVPAGPTNYLLQQSYSSSKMSSIAPNYIWLFDGGKSAGVCDPTSGVFVPNTSQKAQTYNDAFVQFHHPRGTGDGAQTIPFMSSNFFNSTGTPFYYNYAQIWFQHRNHPITDRSNDPSNSWHMLGVSSVPGLLGLTLNATNTALVFEGNIEDPTICRFVSPARACTAQETQNLSAHIVNHEDTHNMGIDGAGDENPADWAWCGYTSDPVTFSCPNPNAAYPGQICIMGPFTIGDDSIVSMKTDGVIRWDCVWLFGQACHGEPTGSKVNIRAQTDPQ